MKENSPDKKKTLFPNRGRKTIFSAGLFLTLFFICFFLYRPAFVTFLDQKLYDVMHLSLTDRGTTPQPVIVDINDQSLEAYGQWPWSRDLLARLCTIITQGSPRAVGMDILLSEPDRTSIHLALSTLKKRSGISIPIVSPSDTLLDNDLNLTQVLRQGPFILACKFLGQETAHLPPGLLPLDTTLISKDSHTDLFQWFPPWKGVLAALPQFLQATQGSGFVNALSDSDGIIRRTPFIMGYKGKFYPSLSLATLMLAMDTNKVSLESSAAGLTSVSIKILPYPCRPRPPFAAFSKINLPFHNPVCQ